MKKKSKRLLTFLLILLLIFAGLIAAFYEVFDVSAWQRLDKYKLTQLSQTSLLFDRDGNLLSEIRGAENRTVVSLQDIPEHTQLAFIAAEDLRFYSHKGIDPYRILGAIRSNLKSGTLAEGASTITQQLAKLTHLSAEKTIKRKLEEISLAFQIEQAYSKQEILEMYPDIIQKKGPVKGTHYSKRTVSHVEEVEATVVEVVQEEVVNPLDCFEERELVEYLRAKGWVVNIYREKTVIETL